MKDSKYPNLEVIEESRDCPCCGAKISEKNPMIPVPETGGRIAACPDCHELLNLCEIPKKKATPEDYATFVCYENGNSKVQKVSANKESGKVTLYLDNGKAFEFEKECIKENALDSAVGLPMKEVVNRRDPFAHSKGDVYQPSNG